MRFHRSPSFGARCAIVAGLSCALVGASVPVPAYADLSSDLAAARTQLEQIGSEYAAINGEITKLGKDLKKTVAEIEKTSGKLNDAQDELAHYASLGYKEGGVSLTKVIVNANSLSDVLSNIFYMNKVSSAQANLIDEVKDLQDELKDQQEEQQTAMDSAEKRLAAQAENQARAAALVSSLDAQLQEQLAAEAAENEAIQQGLQSAEDNETGNTATGGSEDSVDREDEGSNDEGSGNREDEGSEGNSNSGDSSHSDSSDKNDDGGDSGSSSGGNGGSSVTGSSALSIALQFEGSPYVLGGASPEEGFDCSGLTMYAYAQLGISLPHSASAQMSVLQSSGRFTTNINELQYGDLVFFPGHVAFYTGNGNCFGARRPGVPASETKMAYFGAFLGGGNF